MIIEVQMKSKRSRIRPLFKTHGGKYYLSRKIVDLIPKHTTYVEPFAGGASVLLNKDRSEVEVLSDLDDRTMSVYFEMMANPAIFHAKLKTLTYSEATFNAASELKTSIDVLVRNRMSRGGLGNAFAWSNRLRGGKPGDVNAWETFVNKVIQAIVERLEGIHLSNDSAFDVIPKYDSDDTLFYVDPPYMKQTKTVDTYRFELTNIEHERLAKMLCSCKGKVMLSGYWCRDYANWYADWNAISWDMPNNSGQSKQKQRREEWLWMNF